jgi:hypothetical protein
VNVIGEQPYWLSGPCPVWCRVDHQDFDLGRDRDHFSRRLTSIVVSEVKPRRTLTVDGHTIEPRIPTVDVNLNQDHRAVAPVVEIIQAEKQIRLRLTLVEVTQLIDALTKVMDLADGAL